MQSDARSATNRRGVWARAAFVAGPGLALAALACASPPPQPSGAGGARPENVASVDGRNISLEAVDRRIANDLFEEEFGSGGATRLHERRRKTLDAMIDEYLVARAAGGEDLGAEDWLARASAAQPPVTSDEIETFFAENRGQIGDGVTLDELTPQIRAYLEQTRRAAIFEKLRGQATIEIELQRPRVTVADLGPSLGAEAAVVTIVGFGDYQCPFCARSEATIRELLERYPETLRYVQRHHPLSIHPEARGAAEAAVCAEAQGRFWDYHDLLFANQSSQARDALTGYAEQLGLDTAAFEQCLSSEATARRVQRDIDAARGAGASGTPAFFVNGIPLTGAQPIDEFEALIDEELTRLSQ